MKPEEQARQQIDAQLVACGWTIQDYAQFNPAAARGIALRDLRAVLEQFETLTEDLNGTKVEAEK